MSEVVKKDLTPDAPIEILGILSHYKNQHGNYSIQAIAGNSGLHVRPSMALFGIISKYGSIDVFINGIPITSALDIISLGLVGNIHFEIELRGGALQEKDILDFIQDINDIEKPEVAGCESVPNAIQRILGGNL